MWGIRSPYEWAGFNPYLKIIFIKLKIDLQEAQAFSKNDYQGFIQIIQPLNWLQKLPRIEKVFYTNRKLRYYVWRYTGITLKSVYVIRYIKFF